MNFDTIKNAATEAAKLNAILKRLQKENRFTIQVGESPGLILESGFGNGPLQKIVEDWLADQIAKQAIIIESELAKRN